MSGMTPRFSVLGSAVTAGTLDAFAGFVLVVIAFAIKILRQEVSIDDEIRRRFLREGYAANSVKHPGVVAIVDDDVDEDGCAFLVMELLDGESVEEILGKLGGNMPGPPAFAIMIRVLDVLAAAHDKGILHRDIKPANVFLTKSGEVKVLDFGIARVRDGSTSATATSTNGASFGTPAFMAPEQALGKVKETDARSDVWQCSAALFTMLTGQFVHEATTAQHLLVLSATQPPRSISKVIPSIPPPIAAVIDTALAFDKKDRWESAAAFRDALTAACNEVFGGVLDAAGLAAFAASVPAATQTTRRVGAVAPAVGSTTAQGISSDKQRTTRSSRRTVYIVGSAAAGLLVVGIVAAFAVAASHKSAATATSITMSVSAPQPSPPPPPATTALETVVQPSDLPPAPTVSSVAHPKTTIATTRASTGAQTPHAVSSNCTPLYWLDREGNKHWKPECFAK